jgi:hypothetical protein
MDEKNWTKMVDEIPHQGARIIAKLYNGSIRITDSYCRFCWEHWKIVEWKMLPAKAHRETK